ncbi:MAG: phosphoribosyl-AMP cyclohydrolase [Pseudomonadota bacterium]
MALADWGDGLVAISRAYDTDGVDGARTVAKSFLEASYNYGLGPVLFKPTMASGEQTFRPTFQGALSYFVGHDPDFPLDGGFGLKGWRSVTADTSAHFADGDVAMWMGWVSMTDKDGQVATVDKSFGYQRDASGRLRIVLHHSSWPYQP